ncbi:MAG: hypothetical protein ACRDCE_00915 [Cetobacterium sp.]|uniref:hypothetical protein n=1 Tax=Cetobacterium sp. TaxID=2071632 RepID=UPI003EE6E6C9
MIALENTLIKITQVKAADLIKLSETFQYNFKDTIYGNHMHEEITAASILDLSVNHVFVLYKDKGRQQKVVMVKIVHKDDIELLKDKKYGDFSGFMLFLKSSYNIKEYQQFLNKAYRTHKKFIGVENR